MASAGSGAEDYFTQHRVGAGPQVPGVDQDLRGQQLPWWQAPWQTRLWRSAFELCGALDQLLSGLSGTTEQESRLAQSPSRTSIANPRKIVWVSPEDISFKISGDLALHPKDVLPGGWDLRRVAISDSIKHRSILAHYQSGIPWEDTGLFKRYAARLSRGELVRGADRLSKLAQQYESKVEAVFNSLREKGFLISRDGFGRPVNLPHIHIGRDGEILYGTKGNHRLPWRRSCRSICFPARCASVTAIGRPSGIGSSRMVSTNCRGWGALSSSAIRT